jgi:uncharacterized protein (TIGR02231 family)
MRVPTTTRRTPARRAPPPWLAGALALALGASAAPLARAAADTAPPAGGALEGEIDSVVLFSDRARVTRVRAVRCEGGTAQAAFDRLPASLDARTLRGEAREAADVIGVASAEVNDEQQVDLRAREAAARQRKIEADISAALGRRAAVLGQLQALQGYGEVLAATLAEEIRNPSPPTPLWASATDGLRARRAALDEERRKIDVELRALRLQAGRAERELARTGAAAAARSYRTATVTIGCRGLSHVTATLSYVVPGATWQPEYDLDFTPAARAKAGPGTARLTVGALFRQATGEDWRGVRVMLSTARPKLGAEVPQAAPLLVDGREERHDKVLVSARERRDRLDAGGATATRAAAQGAALDDKGNAFVLTLPHRVTVPADGRPVWAPVDAVEAPATAKLVATPKLDEHVYQVVALKNPAPYALLDGRVRSYRAGSYIGDSQLRYHGVGEPLEISLGIDDELKVTRKALNEKERGSSFLSTTKQIVRAYRIALTNRAAAAATVELRESVPVSKTDDVGVKLVDGATTPGYALDPTRGFITWPVALQSGEQRNVDIGYTIRLPDDWVVTGVP